MPTIHDIDKSPSHRPHRVGHSLTFFREFVRRPGSIGAIAPSSRHLAEAMVAHARVASARVILEFGAGTGSFTASILEAMPSEARLVAIEHNPRLCDILRRRFPVLSVAADSVEHAGRILQEQDLPPACCIVSGLPWAAFDEDLQDRLLAATVTALRPQGRFVTFTYAHSLLLPAAKRFRRKIDRLFADVTTSRIVWRNLPPALVYCCTTSNGAV
jgi:phosphatidylethanolamine/phosphatidyl-N-methylethanolamine N-methyltransferase